MVREYEQRLSDMERRLSDAEGRARGAGAGTKAGTAASAAASRPPSPGESDTGSASALDKALEEVGGAQAAGAPSALDKALEQLGRPRETAVPGTTTAAAAVPRGGAGWKLLDLSLVMDTAAGWSSKSDNVIKTLEGGDHDPKRRGFTLQQAEIGLKGAVDPYFTGEAYIVYGEDSVELEEAYLTTLALPHGLQAKAGQFLTDFGRRNPTHPHAWYWQDQPIVNTRLMGPEGMRSPGAQLAWLMPTPWYSELVVGAQNAGNEAMASFRGDQPEGSVSDSVGGRTADQSLETGNLTDLVYLLRWNGSWNFGDEWTTKLGFSGAFGPNNSGPDRDTRIYGMDLLARWKPVNNFRGWPFLQVEGEIMQRDYQAAAYLDQGDPGNPADDTFYPADTLHDWGFYLEAVYGIHYHWVAGLRLEDVGGSGASVGGRSADPYRDNRYRISPLLAWYPSEFSRLRLQYNYDNARHLEGGDAHSVWLGVEILYGAHPAHSF